MLRILLIPILMCFSALQSAGQHTTLKVTLKGGGCENAPVRFEASVSSTVTYTSRWWKVGSLRDHALTSNSRIYEILSARLSDAGQYYCVVTETESGYELYSDTLSLLVNPLPVRLPLGVPSIGERNDLPVEALDNNGALIDGRKLTWSYGTLIQWQAGTAIHLPSGSGGNPFMLRGSTSDMILKVRYDEGVCTGYDSLRVRVKPSRYYWGGSDDGYARVSSAFRVELNTPLERDYCVGETIRFKITAISDGGSSNFQYQWWHIVGGNNIAVSSDTAFRLSPARVADAGAYYCEVRDENGFVVLSDTQHLTLTPLTIRVQPRTAYAGEGEEVKVTAFSDTGTVLGGDSLSWYAGGAPPVVSGDSVYLFTAGSADAFIRATYTNWKGCKAADSLHVITKPDILSVGGVEDGFSKVGAAFTVERIHPVGKVEEYCAGGGVPLKAQVTGEDNANYTFRWWKVSRPSDRLVAEKDTINLKNLSAADAGLYYCEARDANGYIAYTDTLLLTLHNVELPGTFYATEGEHVTFTAYNTKAEVITTSLTWYERMDGDTEFYPLPDTDNPLKYAIGSGNTMLRVISNLLPGCSATDSTRVIVRKNGLFKGTQGDGFDVTGVPPVIIRPYLPATLCSAYDSVNLQVFAEGSELEYQWQVLADGGKWINVENAASVQGYNVMGSGSSLLRLTSMPEEYRGKLRCAVFNDLDTVYSNNVTLYGHHLLQASVDPEVVRLGDETSATVAVRLEHGIKPWAYRYQNPSGVVRIRSGLQDSVNLFSVSDLGMYRLTYLSDSLGCELTADLPDVEVTTYKIPKITISGDNEVCAGTNVNLLLSILEGIGPWEITLHCDGVPADNLGISWPLKVTTRDTSIWFYANTGGLYTVDTITDLNKGGKRWGGVTSGKASIKVRESDDLRFKIIRDNHIGSCKPVDLIALLQPTVNGVVENGGSFYTDGFLVSSLWQPDPGMHTIRYIQRPNIFGCASKVEVDLIADMQPSVQLILPGSLCENDTAVLLVRSTGNNVSFDLKQERVSRLFFGGSPVVTEKIYQVPASLTHMDYRENLKFLPEDSCLIYTVNNIADKHGCRPSGLLKYSDTLIHHFRPALQLHVRYPDVADAQWVPVSDTLWTIGDEAGIKGALITGDKATAMVYMRNEANGESSFPLDTENKISSEGAYRFKITDAFCANDEAARLVVKLTPGGYLRLKVRLEGNIVDPKQLLVELLDGETVVAVDTCWVLSDGIVRNRDGGGILSVWDFHRQSLQPLRGEYRIAVHCVGYLSVVSKRTYRVSATASDTPLLDFTDELNVYQETGNPANHMTRIGERDGKAIWGLSTVEGNGNNLISVSDANVTVTEPVRFSTGGDETGRTRKNRDKHGQNIKK